MLRRDRREPTSNTRLDLTRVFDKQQSHKDFVVLNISRGGLCFSSTEVFTVDERVNIIVFRNDQETHQAMGRICYRTETEAGDDLYGISFLDKYLDADIQKTA